jgi:predicted nuclease with RNAse H fold
MADARRQSSMRPSPEEEVARELSLRRVIERYPETTAAARAEHQLQTLKGLVEDRRADAALDRALLKLRAIGRARHEEAVRVVPEVEAEAQRALREVVERYPGTTAADRAKEELRRLKGLVEDWLADAAFDRALLKLGAVSGARREGSLRLLLEAEVEAELAFRLVVVRYPGTTAADRAKEGLQMLGARVDVARETPARQSRTDHD